jgi:hypothetical protein
MTYVILHNKTRKIVKVFLDNKGNDGRILIFKYPIQAMSYIQRNLGNSQAFSIVKLRKKER